MEKEEAEWIKFMRGVTLEASQGTRARMEESRLKKHLWPINVPEGEDPCKICTVDDVHSPPDTCIKCPYNPFNKRAHTSLLKLFYNYVSF